MLIMRDNWDKSGLRQYFPNAGGCGVVWVLLKLSPVLSHLMGQEKIGIGKCSGADPGRVDWVVEQHTKKI